jgi:hypothetical protein
MLKIWKVIFATAVIFAAGFVTGGLVFREMQIRETKAPVRPEVAHRDPNPPGPIIIHERFLERMKRELDLTPDQVAHFDKIFAESRERNRILMELIDPEIKEELRSVREKIRAELRPDQREKFELLLKHKKQGPGDQRRGQPGERRGTNAPASTNSPTS